VKPEVVIESWMQQHQQRIESALENVLSEQNQPSSTKLNEAMRYATLGGGKRLRALLVYATGQSLSANAEALDAAAAAVEMIHAYSLVHDDMPIMDNDDLRRGRPTCHKAFGDATALLVGDALQSLAFQTLCNAKLSAEQQSEMVKYLAQASGSYGMAGGQAIDLESVGQALNLEQLETMHRLKTGALIKASVRLGAIAGNSDADTLAHLDVFAERIGLAFQVQDDVLDVIADTKTLGKTQGADLALNKPTYPALLGLKQAQQKAADLIAEAMASIKQLPFNTEVLQALAMFVIKRSH